jgi:hypothetical protein
MALPKSTFPIYSMVVPSTEKTVKFRPFRVKEEKNLLIAQQSEDISVMIDTLKGIISTCVLDPINVDELAIFDIEYMFTQIRAKSVGENVELIFTCAHCTDKNNKVKIEIDLTKIPMIKSPNHSTKIQLNDSIGVIMRYPRIEALKLVDANKANTDVELAIDAVIDCVHAVYDDKEVFYTADQTREEVVDFIENLSKKEFAMIEDFFVSVPKYEQKIEYTCPACKASNSYTLKGTDNFF